MDRPRSRRAPKRVQFGRLVVLVALSIFGSAGVATAVHTALPAEPTLVMADPDFDADEFYETRFPQRSSRDTGRATVAGAPTSVKPVAGLTQAQTNVAYIIVEVGRQLNLPERAYVVAIATAMQETRLRNLANPKVPASLKMPNDGTGTDHDSVGIMQQRPSMGWGTVAQLMDPAQATARFYAKLVRVPGWQKMSVAGAAQAVQRSAFASAYAKHATKAQEIVDALPAAWQ